MEVLQVQYAFYFTADGSDWDPLRIWYFIGICIPLGSWLCLILYIL